jgi:glycine dehydrogenase subunit 1
MMRYIPHTPDDVAAMLRAAGAGSVDELFAPVPADCRMKGDLKLPPSLTEWELTDKLEALAAANTLPVKTESFLGAGCYDHHVPAVVPSLAGRAEFLTAYTPYQPEASQGTLQGIYEFQTLVCRLHGMDVANASMYDGASALAEALLMALRITGKKKVAVSRAVHPHYRAVAATYLEPGGFEIIELPYGKDGRTDLSGLDGDEFAAVAVQSPNFFGCIEDLGAAAKNAHDRKALAVAAFTEPVAYGLLRDPGSADIDIVCGEGRSFGLSQYAGGVSLGLFAAKRAYVRSMPGRLVGKTVDREGKRGFVLTLSTREQHIRREKATSNICSNQSLCALTAAIHMACLGKTGIRSLAQANFDNAEYLRERLRGAGYRTRFSGPTFNEFVVEFPAGFEREYDSLAERGFVAGTGLGKFYPELSGCYLLCATETKSRKAIDAFVKEVAAWLKK